MDFFPREAYVILTELFFTSGNLRNFSGSFVGILTDLHIWYIMSEFLTELILPRMFPEKKYFLDYCP